MKAVFSALKAEQKRLARELRNVESLMSRAGVGAVTRRKRRVVRRKKSKTATETKAAAAKTKKGGKKRATKTIDQELDEVEAMRARKAKRDAEKEQE